MYCAVIVTVQTSCSSDNDANPAMPGGQDVITVNTASLYEKLGIAEQMTDQLAAGEYTLTDTIIIYDHMPHIVCLFQG